MAQEAQNLDVSSLTNELDEALATLDSALLQAGRSVAMIRANVAQFAQIGDAVREMEAAMARARDQLSGSWSIDTPAEPAQLHAVPAPAPAPPAAPQSEPLPPQPEPEAPQEYAEPIAEQPSIIDTDPSTRQAPQPEAEQPAESEPEVQEEPAEQPQEQNISTARCLRLGVSSKGGSLDLKAVDGSVNENPSVVDVALLDYDGRHATLKLWINESADPNGVRDALIASLRSRLGDEGEAEVSIEFEEDSVA